MAFAVLVFVFVGFAPTYYLRSHFQTTPLPLYLHVHGFAFTAWIVLFTAQTMLVAARRIDVHRRLGWAGAVMAVLMVVAAFAAAILSGRRDVAAGHEDAALTFLTTPFLAMLVFIILVGAAVYYRRRAETHKRLMLLATISILDAAVARWPLEFVATSAWALYVLTDLLIAAAILYDVVSRRRVHPVYLWGGPLILAGQSLRTVLGQTETWHAILERSFCKIAAVVVLAVTFVALALGGAPVFEHDDCAAGEPRPRHREARTMAGGSRTTRDRHADAPALEIGRWRGATRWTCGSRSASSC